MAKGKKAFTKRVADEIRGLLRQKTMADPHRQKAIRAKIRKKLGFWSTDFAPNNSMFTAADFDALVRDGRIHIIGDRG